MTDDPKVRHLGDPLLLTIVYTSHRGETAIRKVIPREVWFGVSPYHHRPQWFLKAFDVDKGEERDFAMCDMRGTR